MLSMQLLSEVSPLTATSPHNIQMISKQYIKPSLTVYEFELDDVITASVPVITTAPATTLPGTTSGGVDVTDSGGGNIVFDYGDLIS